MRADTGTPGLGNTGADLTSLVPAGNGVMPATLWQGERKQAEGHGETQSLRR